MEVQRRNDCLRCSLKINHHFHLSSPLQRSHNHGCERGGRRFGRRNPPPHQRAGSEKAAEAAGGGAGGGQGGRGGQRPGRGGDIAACHAANQILRGHAGGYRICPVNTTRLCFLLFAPTI